MAPKTTTKSRGLTESDASRGGERRRRRGWTRTDSGRALVFLKENRAYEGKATTSTPSGYPLSTSYLPTDACILYRFRAEKRASFLIRGCLPNISTPLPPFTEGNVHYKTRQIGMNRGTFLVSAVLEAAATRHLAERQPPAPDVPIVQQRSPQAAHYAADEPNRVA